MILFQKTSPKYLISRNGIFYFQLRLPKDHDKRRKYKSGLVRRSLKTTDIKKAKKLALLLWAQITMKDIDVNDQIEAETKRLGALFTRGKELIEIYDRIDPLDYDG